MSLISRIVKQLSPVRIFVLFILAVAVIAGVVVVVTERQAADQRAHTDEEFSIISRAITIQDHTIGNVSAPIQVVVYADFECQFCEQLFETQVPELEKAFNNQIVFAYRHRTLNSEPGSNIEEAASECVYQAGGNSAFWHFATEMFTMPNSASKEATSTLMAVAARAGVPSSTFMSCMDAGRGEPRVAQDDLEASVAGIDADPSMVLKSAYRGLVVKGDYYSQLYAGIQYLFETNAQIKQGY